VPNVIFFALAVATFASLILLPMSIVFMFANRLERGARVIWAINVVVSVGTSVWNWISMLAEVKRCEDFLLHPPPALAQADRLAFGNACATGMQLHAALQFAVILLLGSALVWSRQKNKT
jgi:hypothetical protein